MVTAVFTDALCGKGTQDWDTTVSDCLSLALQAALAARCGDFKQSKRYKGEEYLKWRDINIVACGDSAANPQLKMVITLHYTKGFKSVTFLHTLSLYFC